MLVATAQAAVLGFNMRRRPFLLSGLAVVGASAARPVWAQSVPDPQAPALDDKIGPGYSRLVITNWGDALQPDSPAFAPDALTAAQASGQFPYDAVIAGLISPPPAQDGIPRRILVTANPTAPARMLFPAGLDNPDVAGKEQGVTVMNLQYLAGEWVTVIGGYQTRRLSDGTLCQMAGPVAANIGDTAQGVLAVNSGCVTPWGSMLLTEGDCTPWLSRLSGLGLGYDSPQNAPLYGWIIEFDPLNPLALPVKQTALGRMARQGIVATVSKAGLPVVFFTQSAPAGMLFRFIGSAAGSLSSGQLSVAILNDTGIEWVDLPDAPSALAELADSATTVGGETFDAPGGLALSADGGTLYMACGGNADRSVADLLNPRAGCNDGHIIRFTLPGADSTAQTFQGQIALVAGDPATSPATQYGPGSEAWLRKPQTLAIDPAGNLWIGTNQYGNTTQTADGLFVMQTNGPAQGAVAYAYLAPVGAAAGGVAFDIDTKTAIGAIRHPGATPGASFDNPATRWPTLRPDMPPQTTIIGLVTV